MSERRPMDKIIRDWLVELPEGKFDSRISPDEMLRLVKMAVHYGWEEQDIDSEVFKNRVVQRVTHEFSSKEKAWKKVTWDRIDRAIGVWFLPKERIELTDDEVQRASRDLTPEEIEIRKQKSTNPDDEPAQDPNYSPPEIVPADRTKFRTPQTPVEDPNILLEKLGLKNE